MVNRRIYRERSPKRVTASTVFRPGRGPFQLGPQKNSSALAAASKKLSAVVVFE